LETGEALEVTLVAYGKKKAKAAKAKRPKENLDTYGLGGTAALRMSKKVNNKSLEFSCAAPVGII